MKRRAAAALALVALLALGVGVYARFFRATAPPDAPRHVDDHARLPTPEEFEHLAAADPVALLDACLKRYERETTNAFTAILVKKERVKGDPKPPAAPPEEEVALSARGEVPDPATGKPCIEVLMKWTPGKARKFLGAEIRGALYSERPGDAGTGGKVATWRPDATFGTPPIPAGSSLAQGQSRYCIRDAGVYRGMLRTYDAWKGRKEAGTLRTEFVGKRAVPEVGGRVCLVIDRTCDAPEIDAFEFGNEPKADARTLANEGFTRVRIMIDAETWLQVGTELYRPDGALLAAYYFRDPNTKATLPPDTFTEANLKR